MEEAVTTLADPVAKALALASTPGKEFAPADLLAVMGADPNPTSTIDDMDRGNAQFSAIQKDFGFLQTYKMTQKSPSTEEQDRLVSLMRWLMREFNDWTLANDPECRRLAALLIVTAYCRQQGNFWPAFAAAAKINPGLKDELGRRLARLRSTPGASGRSRTPISDKEIIERFIAADAAGDWATVISEWFRFGDLVFPDAFILQAVRYLHTFAPSALSHATDQIRQMLPVMLVLSSLTVSESLSLALVSTNPYVQFGSILRLFQQQRRNRENIAPAEEALLTQLFLAVASNATEWEKWMLALNRYPIQQQAIQVALGSALAHAPDAALGPYIDAIHLSTMGAGRGVIAECLRAFRSAASLSRRQGLWKLAHERWAKWKFGMGDKDQHLTQIGQCELDYAIVGFAVECMSARDRDDAYAALAAELSLLNDAWHASVVDFRQSVNRILSRLQPYGYAKQVGPADDWLMENRYVLPFDPQKDRYNAMLFKIQKF
jgi:hypothetical protein